MAIASFGCGFLFGAGLLISGMAQPAKISQFPRSVRDLGSQLAGDGGGACGLQRRIAIARPRKPLLASQNLWPTSTGIDVPLVAGLCCSASDRGLVGLCPGPALVDLATLSPQVIVFVAAMATGMTLHDWWRRHRARLLAEVDG